MSNLNSNAAAPARSSFEWRWNEAEIGGGEVPCGKCGKMHDPSMEPAPFVVGSESPCCKECVEADPSAMAGYARAVEEAKGEMRAAIAALEDVALRLSVSRSLREPGPPADKCDLCDCDAPALRKASMVNVCDKCWDGATWPEFPDLEVASV
jgi:hypothetical protein